MPRIFVPQNDFPNITGTDVHYLKNVLRRSISDEIELLDGSGKIHRAVILEIKPDIINCKIIGTIQEENEPSVQITIAQALPKSKKMDFIAQKCTELGISDILPVVTERSIAKDINIERVRKIVKSAAEQSGRAIIPKVHLLTKFKDVLKTKDQYDLALIPWELEKENTLKKTLRNHLESKKIIFMVGPEGGFSQEEGRLAQSAGFVPVSLGKRILRTETAGISVLSSILYELE